MVDWSDPQSRLTPEGHFTVHEALWLPSWQVHHQPNEHEKATILKQAGKMERIRKILCGHLGRDVPIHVHVWIRPISVQCNDEKFTGKNYNWYVGGAPKSQHRAGGATDWHADGYETDVECKTIRRVLVPFLEDLDIRMEDQDGSWIHTDIGPVIMRRFFKP